MSTFLNMLKNFFIWFLIFPVFCLGQEQTAEYNLTVPKFIPYNSYFEISLVTTNIQANAELLSLSIIPSEKISITGIEMNISGLPSALELSKENFRGNAYNADINLNELGIKSGDFFHLIIQLKPDGVIQGSIDLGGTYYLNGEEMGIIGTRSNPPFAELNFYKPHRTAGKSLELKGRDFFSVKNIHSGVKRLGTEFWFKFITPGISFLDIVGPSGDKRFTLRLNKSRVLEIDSENPVIESFPVFLSTRSWNHFAVILSAEDQKAEFYCNDILVAVYRLKMRETGNTVFRFTNSILSPYYLDLLRFTSCREEASRRFRDRSYISFLSEESMLLEQFTFDDPSELREKDYLDLSEAALARSDAPIFPRAPELNVKILSTSFLLEWTGGDYKHADHYVVEKSAGNEYKVLEHITVDNDVEKMYTYLDSREEGKEIIYYRIQQINKDGSSVYSSEVKIGQGEFEPFTLGQNYPNPFNPATSIEIELLIDTEVEIIVYNLEGSEVARLYKGMLNKGIHKFAFDAGGLPSGIYLYKVSTPEYSQTRKMILAK